MKFVIRPRQCGATTESIDMAVRHNAIIIVPSNAIARRVKESAFGMGVKVDAIGLSPSAIIKARRQNVIFDNADMFINSFCHKHHLNCVGVCGAGIPEKFYSARQSAEEWQRDAQDTDYREWAISKYGKFWEADHE